MIKKITASFSLMIIASLLTVSCGPPVLAPTITEPAIPPHYTTYTSEGLFSISYPPDWVPATSIIEEVLEWAKQLVESTDPQVQTEDVKMLFLGGIPIGEGYYHPNVNVLVGPRSIGYWTLDEIVEVENQWAREYLQEYREYSQVRTVVDGREAIKVDCENYDSDAGTLRYLQLYTIKDKFVWVVTCTVISEEFKDFEDTFHSIVRSLRILK